MIRNYRLGDYESLDMTITDAGSDQIKLRYDGLEGCAFSDLELYSDSGRTTALSVSDWEYYTEDTGKTTKELETGGSSKTIYKEIRILNPTYQTGSIYATFNNFGTYPDGSVLGIDYIEISANYAYTTQRNLMTYLVCDGLSADITITVTDAGFDERSRFKVVNKDSTYKVIVEDDTALDPYWVIPSQSVDFYDVGTTLVWASGGWEEIMFDVARPTTKTFLVPNGLYDFEVKSSASTLYRGAIRIDDTWGLNYGVWSGASDLVYNTSTGVWTPQNGYGILRIRKWHEAK